MILRYQIRTVSFRKSFSIASFHTEPTIKQDKKEELKSREKI